MIMIQSAQTWLDRWIVQSISGEYWRDTDGIRTQCWQQQNQEGKRELEEVYRKDREGEK
jgi:hypothetical protein